MNGMHRLIRELLLQAQDRYDGVSGRQLAEIAKASGYQIDRTQINAILAGTYSSVLRPKTLDAVAFLSGRPRDLVYSLAGEPVPGAPFAEELPADADLLSTPQRRAVLATIREFAAAQRLSVHIPLNEAEKLLDAETDRKDPSAKERRERWQREFSERRTERMAADETSEGPNATPPGQSEEGEL